MSTVPPPPPESPTQQFASSRDAKAHAKAAKAYQKANRPWYKKKRFWLLGIIALLIIFGIASQGGDDSGTASEEPTQNVAQQPTPDTNEDDDAAGKAEPADEESSEAKEEPAEEAAAEAPVETTAKQMIDDLEANALKAKTTYEGKVVTVSGFVGNIDASGDYFALDPEPDAFILTGIQVQLDESHIETVSNYTQGQEVTVTGKVTSVGEIMGYSIDAGTLD